MRSRQHVRTLRQGRPPSPRRSYRSPRGRGSTWMRSLIRPHRLHEIASTAFRVRQPERCSSFNPKSTTGSGTSNSTPVTPEGSLGIGPAATCTPAWLSASRLTVISVLLSFPASGGLHPPKARAMNRQGDLHEERRGLGQMNVYCGGPAPEGLRCPCDAFSD